MAAYLVCFKLKDDKKLNNEISVDSLADEINPLLDTKDDFLISYICIPNRGRRDTKLHEWVNKYIDAPPEPLINELL